MGRGAVPGLCPEHTVKITARAQVCIVGRPIDSRVGAKSQFWDEDGQAVSVEQLALQHYASPEAGAWQGVPLL